MAQNANPTDRTSHLTEQSKASFGNMSSSTDSRNASNDSSTATSLTSVHFDDSENIDPRVQNPSPAHHNAFGRAYNRTPLQDITDGRRPRISASPPREISFDVYQEEEQPVRQSLPTRCMR